MAGALSARSRVAALAVALSAASACGGGSGPGEAERAAPWVDPDGDPPLVGALDVNPADGALYMATNEGLYALSRGARRLRRVSGRLTTEEGSAPLSRALTVRFTGPDRLVGSGHPDTEGELPPVLGLLRSDDAGRSWHSVSYLGDADFHDLQQIGSDLFAAKAGTAEVVVFRAGGRIEGRAMPSALVDLEIDPSDRRRWVASTAQGVFVSADEGRTWRSRDPVPNSYLAWAASDRLYRVDPDGPVRVSADGGRAWSRVGSIEGEPARLTAEGTTLYLALSDGTVRRSRDGGRSWTDLLAPARRS